MHKVSTAPRGTPPVPDPHKCLPLQPLTLIIIDFLRACLHVMNGSSGWTKSNARVLFWYYFPTGM